MSLKPSSKSSQFFGTLAHGLSGLSLAMRSISDAIGRNLSFSMRERSILDEIAGKVDLHTDAVKQKLVEEMSVSSCHRLYI